MQRTCDNGTPLRMLNNKPIDSSFVKFIAGPTPPKKAAIRITLNSQSHIYFNARAYDVLGKPANVYLYYSPLKEEILIERTEYRHTPAFPMIKRQNGWVVQAAPFCRNHRITFPGTKQFIDPRFEDGRVYLNINKTVIVECFRRKRARA